MSKHTKGPWIFEDNEIYRPGGITPEIYSPDGAVVARAYGYPGNCKGPGSNAIDSLRSLERIANAKLIAAAPDLLTACEAFLETIITEKPSPEEHRVMMKIGDAVKKATVQS